MRLGILWVQRVHDRPLADAFIVNLVLTGGLSACDHLAHHGFGQEAEYWLGAWSSVSAHLMRLLSLGRLAGLVTTVAWINPAAHVFEGMRGLLASQTAPIASLGLAMGLNALYVVAVIAWFHNYLQCMQRSWIAGAGGRITGANTESDQGNGNEHHIRARPAGPIGSGS